MILETSHGHFVKADGQFLCWSDRVNRNDWATREDNEAGWIWLGDDIREIRMQGDAVVAHTGNGGWRLHYVGPPYYYGLARDYAEPYDELGY